MGRSMQEHMRTSHLVSFVVGLRAGVCEVRDMREDGKKGKGGRKREDGGHGRVEVASSKGCGGVIGDAALMFSGVDLLSTWSLG